MIAANQFHSYFWMVCMYRAWRGVRGTGFILAYAQHTACLEFYGGVQDVHINKWLTSNVHPPKTIKRCTYFANIIVNTAPVGGATEVAPEGGALVRPSACTPIYLFGRGRERSKTMQ
jgi:hypothetical protein